LARDGTGVSIGSFRGALPPLKHYSPSLVREGDKGGRLLSKYLKGIGLQ